MYPQNALPFNVEVKSGNAMYGGLQYQKDREIFDMYGIETQVIYVNNITWR